MGQTPLKDVNVPRGVMHWKVELAGHDRAEDVGPGPFWPPNFQFRLFPSGQAPTDMVRVASANQPFTIFIPGLEWLDRYLGPGR